MSYLGGYRSVFAAAKRQYRLQLKPNEVLGEARWPLEGVRGELIAAVVVGDMRGADGEGLENARTMGLLPEGPDALRQLRQFPIHNSERVEVFYSVVQILAVRPAISGGVCDAPRLFFG